jgi:hypothetical protein
LDLQKWFLAISLVLNAKKEYSARQLGRDISVIKDSAWRMLMQIRKAFVEEHALLEGIIEADETYVGGKEQKSIGSSVPITLSQFSISYPLRRSP